jgi:hypothetical protein
MSWTYQVVEFDGGDALIDARNDLLGDCHGVNVLWVQAVTKPGHASSDFVELNALTASIYATLVLGPYRQGVHTAFEDKHVDKGLCKAVA